MKMPRRTSRRRRLLLAAGALLILAAVATSWAATVTTRRIEQRFSGRRWRLPSRVYSDVTLLYPGMRLNRRALLEKLRRLDYRPVDHRPTAIGEMRLRGTTLEIFLQPLEMPDHHRSPMAVSIDLRPDRIVTIRRIKDRQRLPLLEIEPEELALFFGPQREQRRLVSIEHLPAHFIQAILTAEDRRFFDHHGVDPRSILRALAVNVRQGAIHQGGSTITQQLAKNYFLTSERTVARKLKEMAIALLIELHYDKPTILEIYLNEIYLGQAGSVSINGAGAASRYYFGKPASQLDLAESAVLAALIRGPNAYSPHRHPERCRRRQHAILRQMHQRGVISQQQLQRAMKTVLSLAPPDAFTPRAPYFVDYLSDQLSRLYSAADLASLGLAIHTTLDTFVQDAAEKALQRGLQRLERRSRTAGHPSSTSGLQGAVVVLQPKTGNLLAMVGGRSYSESQFNRATHARRQAGSTFKPFVYLAGLDRFTLASALSNAPHTYTVGDETWTPENAVATPEREVSYREALARSINRATVDLAMRLGIDAVADTASAFGFSTEIPRYPSLALGAVEVTPLELSSAFGVFAADGMLAQPLSVRDVISDQGRPLARRHVAIREVIPAAKAFLITSMLQSVVLEGTARRLAGLGVDFPAAGKTGTTSNYRDAWFVGYTPDLLMLVWVGDDDGRPIQATGAEAALPIWADLALAIPHRIAGDDFMVPPGVVKRTVCVPTGGEAASRPCTHRRQEWFLEGTVPVDAVVPDDTPPRLWRWLRRLFGGQ